MLTIFFIINLNSQQRCLIAIKEQGFQISSKHITSLQLLIKYFKLVLNPLT
jgi:hypothetical protein